MAGSNSFWQLSKCRNWTWITPVYYRTKNARKLLTALNFRHGTKLSQSLIFLRFFIASIFPLFSSLTADIDTRVKKNCYLMNDTKSLRNIDSSWYCFRLAFFFFFFLREVVHLTAVAVGGVRVRPAVYGRACGRYTLVPFLGTEDDDRADHRKQKYQTRNGDAYGEAPLWDANTVFRRLKQIDNMLDIQSFVQKNHTQHVTTLNNVI